MKNQTKHLFSKWKMFNLVLGKLHEGNSYTNQEKSILNTCSADGRFLI